MMNEFLLLYVFSVFISSVSQILLKKSAGKHYDVWWREYLNPSVIFAYAVFFGSTFITMLAYQHVPLSTGPIIESLGYVFVAALGFIFLKERIGRQKLIGLAVIIAGILIFQLG